MRAGTRVVLDTNIVLSALLFSQGRLAPLRLAWQRSAFHPLVSKATIAELIGALAYPKFKLSDEDQKELLADYLPYCSVVTVPAKPPKTPACRDAFDLPFLQLALVGKAGYLVTGDQDVLSVAGPMPCRMVRASEFLALVGSAKSG